MKKYRTLNALVLLVGVAAMLMILNLAIGAWLVARGFDQPSRDRSRIAALAGLDWTGEYFRAEDAMRPVFAPFLLSRRGDVHSRYLNMQSGVRETYQAPSLVGAHVIDLFVFGGSAAWGQGSRDLHTIPSELARLAEQKGLPLRVTNYAQPGWVGWHSVIRLTELLALGRRPDIVLFYDGVNDISSQLQQPSDQPTILFAEWFQRSVEHSRDVRDLLERYSVPSIWGRRIAARRASGWDSIGAQLSSAEVERAVGNTARLYNGVVDAVHHLAQSYGFAAAFFWQPTLDTKKPHPLERPLMTTSAMQIKAYQDVIARLDRRVIDVTHALDEAPGPVFLDRVHISEEGNRRMAAALLAHVEPLVGEAQERKRAP